MSNLHTAIAQAGNHAAYDRAAHKGWRRAFFILLAVTLLLAGSLSAYIALHSTVYITVAATPDGRILRLSPLSEPMMSGAALKNWTMTAAIESFTLGHHDWRMRLSAAREYFTNAGFDSFVKGLEDSLFLPRIRDNLQVSSAAAEGAPVITHARRINGRLAWSVEFPMLLTFTAGKQRRDERLLVRALVIRVPLSERTSGIGIAQLIATRRTKS